MKRLSIISLLLIVSVFSIVTEAQSTPAAFPETSVTLNLNSISLPGAPNSISGAEQDLLIQPSPNFSIGESTITSAQMVFAGGRGNYIIKPISTWIQNHSPNLNGYQFQFGITGSAGVVKPVGSVGKAHWGERAGIFLNYVVNGQWGVGFDAEWGNFTGVQSNGYTLAFGPNFHF